MLFLSRIEELRNRMAISLKIRPIRKESMKIDEGCRCLVTVWRLLKQISTFGRQNQERATQNFRTVWPKNNSRIKFTRGKLSRRNIRPFYRKI